MCLTSQHEIISVSLIVKFEFIYHISHLAIFYTVISNYFHPHNFNSVDVVKEIILKLAKRAIVCKWDENVAK